MDAGGEKTLEVREEYWNPELEITKIYLFNQYHEKESCESILIALPGPKS